MVRGCHFVGLGVCPVREDSDVAFVARVSSGLLLPTCALDK